MSLKNRHILLGVGGGVACYRSAELVRLLRAQGAVVRCVMTASAQQFITPLTLESLSGERVYHQLFDLTNQHRMGHIELARWADLLLIAPATANLITRLAHGVADDLLTTLALVCEAPIVVAPAMNSSMWQATASKRNVAQLKTDGFTVIGPETGDLACGETGVGRMRSPEQLLDDLCRQLTPSILQGKRLVITSGPTWEPWDSVRLLTNRASGKLGAEIARIAAWHGATVTLIAGPGVPMVEGVTTVAVECAQQMLDAALHHAADAQVFVSAAAVSDYRVAEPSSHKIKRAKAATTTLKLVENRDIVATIAAMDRRPLQVIAFAAEELHDNSTAAIIEGQRKLADKGVDAVIVNDVGNMGAANSGGGYWLTANHEPHPLPQGSKQQWAQAIVQLIAQ